LQHPLPGPAPDPAPRRLLPQPAAVRHVPLAPVRPDPVRARAPRGRPGARLAFRPPLPAAAGRHRLRGLVLPRPHLHPPPAHAGRRPPRGLLTCPTGPVAATRSAGVVLHRPGPEGTEVLLGHMGGPFWARKDEGAWSIPKGEHGPEEDPRDA